MNNNNKNEPLKLIFNNVVLRNYIFDQVRFIFNNVLKKESFKWSSVINRANILIKYNYLEIFKDFLERISKLEIEDKSRLYQSYIESAINYNRVDFIQYMFTNKEIQDHLDISDVRSHLIYTAAMHGRFEILRFIDSYDIDSNDGIIGSEVSVRKDYERSLSIAPYYSFEMMKYLSDRVGTVYTYWRAPLYAAANKGKLELVQWLLENRPQDEKIPEALNEAFSMGHLGLLQWMHENNFIPHDFEFKMKFGSDSPSIFDCVLWAEKHYRLGSVDLIWFEAAKHSLEFVKWVHEKNYPNCNEGVIDHAAEYGRLDVIKWLHQNRTEGCTEFCIDRAATAGYFEIVKWLHENRTEGCTDRALYGAAMGAHIETFKFLEKYYQIPVPTGLFNDVCFNTIDLDIVKYIHQNYKDVHCTTKAIDEAALFNNSFEIICFLAENRTEGCSTRGISNAIRRGNFQILKYLLSRDMVPFQDRFIIDALENYQFDIYFYLKNNYKQSSS